VKLSYLEALNQAQAEEMDRDERVFLMGEDVRHALYGATGGLHARFGDERVRDTPISEVGFLGAGIGAAMTGMRPIVDLGIASFVYVAMDQIVSHAAKSRYMFGGQASIPVTIRAGMFYNNSSAAHHSDRPYPMLMGVPGIKIIAPGSPADAKGLLKAAIREDDPVICFEDVNCWGKREEVPDGDHVVPLGVGRLVREGSDVTLVTISGARGPAEGAADLLAKEGISVEVIDPRTLVPLDRDMILNSVAKTGRLVIADPAHRTCSVASEIAAIAAEEVFDSLRAPIQRVVTPDIQIPFSRSLEQGLYPTRERIVDAIRRIL